MKKTIIAFIILGLHLGICDAAELARLPELLHPTMIDIYKDELFVLEEASVHVFSLKDFSLKRSFGKKGEGPGELMSNPDLPNAMQIFDQKIMVYSYNKLILFSLAGEMLEERRIPFVAFQVMPFGEGYATVRFNRETDGSSKVLVVLCDKKFENPRTIYENRLLNNMKKARIAYPLSTVYFKIYHGKLYVFDQFEEFKICVYDTQGKELPTITQPYERLQVTEKFKKESLDWLRVQPAFKTVSQTIKDMFYFNDFLPVFRYSQVADNKIFVQTYESKAGLCEFYVLDLKGRLLEKLFLPGADRNQFRPTPASLFAFQDNTCFLKYFF